MIVYDGVNNHLRRSQYRAAMIEKQRQPGSPKGEAKPVKRKLDARFSERLNIAMRAAGYTEDGDGKLDVPRLARHARCTRAVIHKYLKPGESKAIEALLLFEIADRLNVSARWLLRDEGSPARVVAPTPGQMQVLNLYSNLSDWSRGTWLSQGEVLHQQQPPLTPHTGDPYSATHHVVHEPDAVKPTR